MDRQIPQKTALETLKNLLGLVNRSGKITFGFDNVKWKTNKGFKGFILIAEDLSPRVKRELSFLKKRGYNIYELKVDKKTLGSWFGKDTVGVLFLPNTKLTFKIEKLLLTDNSLGNELPTSFAEVAGSTTNKEVDNLEAKRIRRATRPRFQSDKKNFKRRFRHKR
ncbi:MAG: ribosomal L7Ae/L30e/S12e/Gadd45 family protein [Aquificota bacterium]|jgi:ribosomal protein L7Ae-like RNA K-turn-binding protein